MRSRNVLISSWEDCQKKLKNPNWPNDVVLYISLKDKKISDVHISLLADLIKEHPLPANTKIILENNQITSEGAKKLISVLNHCGENTSINLKDNKIDETAMAELAKAITEGNFAKGLSVFLDGNPYSEAGAITLRGAEKISTISGKKVTLSFTGGLDYSQENQRLFTRSIPFATMQKSVQAQYIDVVKQLHLQPTHHFHKLPNDVLAKHLLPYLLFTASPAESNPIHSQPIVQNKNDGKKSERH